MTRAALIGVRDFDGLERAAEVLLASGPHVALYDVTIANTRRTYQTALGPLTDDEDAAAGGCWFRFDGNQVMRNVALAHSLVSRGAAHSAAVALCAPSGHRAVWRRWAEVKDGLPCPA